jgi:hypothetical protein
MVGARASGEREPGNEMNNPLKYHINCENKNNSDRANISETTLKMDLFQLYFGCVGQQLVVMWLSPGMDWRNDDDDDRGVFVSQTGDKCLWIYCGFRQL